MATCTTGTCNETAKLRASDAAASDTLGQSISISGNLVLAGAYGRTSSRGAAYLFDLGSCSTGTCNQTKILTASDAANGDSLGWAVAISGNRAVVTAYGDDDGASNSGSAYYYSSISGCGTSCTQTAKLQPATLTGGDLFGYRASMDGTRAVVTSYINNGSRGAGYYFNVSGCSGGVCTETLKLVATSAQAGANLGTYVSISGNTVAIGANGYDDGAGDTGTGYVFTVSP
jgi:hypothetical protein